MSIPTHFQIPFAPQADPAAVVLSADGHCRFTILSARLLRLEFSPDGRFEDRPSQAFWFRRQPVPPFEAVRQGESLELRTGALTLRHSGGRLGRKDLSIEVHAMGATWRLGERPDRNLGGTARTLDATNGWTRLEPGLVSADGWAVVDDSKKLVFNAQSWLEPRNAPPGTLDLYFFGHGHDYLAALRDFTAVAGPVPLIPRWALGNWWSRYWEYSQAEYEELMEEFRRQQIPLAVAVIDMDWHITRTGNDCSGWTGYTWNRKLFPDPAAFMQRLHAGGLRTSLNVHPAEGIHPHEEAYPAMAERLGINPQSADPVVFDIADPRFAAAYFEVLHHPQEQAGVDFWWVDWQQGESSRLPGLDPLYWLNHLHSYDLGREGMKRPFLFSRWPGLGGHRYQIGFSGDTLATWDSLGFQPQFTATASNVAYGWWSHDIGGHMLGERDGELYTRWVQFGLFSPALRLHSTKNPLHERHPWGYDAEVLRLTRAAMQLRHALIPYIYSSAWRTQRESRPLVLPMYYLHPKSPEAYSVPGQYWFGSELVAAPFTAPRHPETGLARQVLWLPKGEWFHFFNGQRYGGGRWQALQGGLDEIPVLARAGAIVPLDGGFAGALKVFSQAGKPAASLLNGMGMASGSNDPCRLPEQLAIHIFPGASNAFELYEDDGQTQAYAAGKFAITRLVQKWEGKRLVFTVEPAEGEIGLLPQKRTLALIFHAIDGEHHVAVRRDGNPLKAGKDYSLQYDAQLEALHLAGISLTPTGRLEVTLETENASLLAFSDRRLERARSILQRMLVPAGPGGEIYKTLPEILAGRSALAQWAGRLTAAQFEALETALQ